MHRAGDFLGQVVRRVGARNGKADAAIAWLRAVWPSVVGPALAAHTVPARCEGGVLEIAAESRSWRAELESLKPQFRARINSAWGGCLVEEIRFASQLAAKRDRIPRALDNDHLPFVRRRAT